MRIRDHPLHRRMRNNVILMRGLLERVKGRRSGKRVVAFHDIPDRAIFHDRIRWLKSNFEILSVEELFKAPANPDRIQIAITFDDGFRCWLENAAPVLEEEGVPALFFVCSGLVGGTREEGLAVIRERLNRCRPGLEPLLLPEMLELAGNPLFEIGGHTTNHQDLGQLKNTNQLAQLIGDDYRKLEAWLGHAPRWFA